MTKGGGAVHRSTHELALAGLLAALAVVLLSLGSLIPLATYAAPVLASSVLLVTREECRPSYAWGCFLVSAALGVMLSADPECSLLYAFLGYYPLKPKLDALRPRAVRTAAKLLLCALAIGAMYALALFVFRLESVVEEFAATVPALLSLTALLGAAVFLMYDLALDRLIILYKRRRTRR